MRAKAVAITAATPAQVLPMAAPPVSALPSADLPSEAAPAVAANLVTGPGSSRLDTLYMQATALLDHERAGDAIGLLERCIVLDPAYAKCYRALGLAYTQRGVDDVAVAYYEKYLTVAPGAVDAPVVRHMIQSVLQASHGFFEASE